MSLYEPMNDNTEPMNDNTEPMPRWWWIKPWSFAISQWKARERHYDKYLKFSRAYAKTNLELFELKKQINWQPIKWQSIETAPKDGTWILGLDLENKEAEIVRWSSKEDYINRSKSEGTSNWKYKPIEGWSCYAYSCAYSKPTHWCSIPKLPK